MITETYSASVLIYTDNNLKNVKYYRKMSNQILGDDTRKARKRLSDIILENLDGWGDEYEQIRQDGGM